MRNIELLFMLIVLSVSSCTLRINSLQGQFDKRLERLHKERDRLPKLTDPIERTKTNITISEILLSLAGDACASEVPSGPATP